MSTTREKELLNHDMEIDAMKNKIFLMEDRQIVAENKASKHLPKDLGEFLGIKHRLRNLKSYVPPADRYADKRAASTMINICDGEHDEVRMILVKQGEEAAEWIQNYFLLSPDVVVSFRKEFVRLLDDWSQDPCEDQDNRGLWSALHLE